MTNKEYNYRIVEYDPRNSLQERLERINEVGHDGFRLVKVVEKEHALIFEKETIHDGCYVCLE